MPVRQRGGARKFPREVAPAFQARKSEPFARAGQFQRQVVARIPAGRDAEVKILFPQLAAQLEQFRPRPAPDLILGAEGGPRRGEGNDGQVRPQTGSQLHRVGLGQQGDVIFLRGGAEQGRGDDKIAQPPEFQDQQPGLHGDTSGEMQKAESRK